VDGLDEVLTFLDSLPEQPSGEISDGYHTFNELYYYRMLYNAAFFNLLPKEWVHKSKRHHTREECFGGGWFIVMAELPTGQISNHYELKDWDLFQVPEKEFADEWDGHTPQEAAKRLHEYLRQKQPVEKKSNALFDKCVENCDPAVMKEVSDNVDKMLGRQPVKGLGDEAESYWIEAGWSKVMTLGRFKTIAKHFYDLGQKSKKPERNVVTREEAIKILKDTHDKALFSVRNALETLVPELAESAVLDEEIKRYFKGWTEDYEGVCHYQRIRLVDCRGIARHFAEWGAEHGKK
jgi:hypothetical protein